LLGDLGARELSALPQGSELLVLLRGGLPLAAAEPSTRSGSSEAGERSFSIQIAFELSECGEHMEDELAAGGFGVDLLGKRNELDALGLDPLDDLQ